ncbi:MAG: hypothetical protein K6E58_02800 [Eubacterium sp.]|nr:hypothetical protein [Eubacterium sp.]
MKKIISLLLVVTLVASCGILVGCGKKDKAKEAATEIASKAKEVETKAEEKKEDVSKAVETKKEKATKKLSEKEKALEKASKEMKKPAPKGPAVHGKGIVGVWTYDQKDYQIPATYTFKKGGRGEYNLAGQIKPLKWKTKGKNIIIRFDDTDADMTQKYKLKGDVLTLYDISDKPVTYYRMG